jgi:hypothetical protein
MEEEKEIWKRWIAETAFSSIKRTYEEYISATRFQLMVKDDSQGILVQPL